MTGWRKAASLQSVDQSSFNILINGKSGGGKTFFACSIAEGLQKMVGGIVVHFDMEDGAKGRVEEGRPDWYMLKGDRATFGNAVNLVDDILSDPEVKIIIVDTLTAWWRDAQTAYSDYVLKNKSYNKNAVNRAKTKEFIVADWAKIKEMYNTLQNKLVYSNKHLICTTRAGDEYDMSNPSRVIKTGNLTAKAESEAQFEFDLNFEMWAETDAKRNKGTVHAKCIRDRWNQINWHTMERPDFKWIEPVFARLGKSHGLSYDVDKRNEANTQAMMDKEAIKKAEDLKMADAILEDKSIVELFVQYEAATGNKVMPAKQKVLAMKYPSVELLTKALQAEIAKTQTKVNGK